MQDYQNKEEILQELYDFAERKLSPQSSYQMKEVLDTCLNEYKLQPEIIKIVILFCKARNLKKSSSHRYLLALAENIHKEKVDNIYDTIEKFFLNPTRIYYEDRKKEKE